MKKIMMSILTGIMAASMIGSATVTAQAEANKAATCVADVVAFMKECRPGETLTFSLSRSCTYEYSWVYTDPKEVEAWMLMLTEEQKTELFDVLDEVGATVEDLSGWQLEESRWQILGL